MNNCHFSPVLSRLALFSRIPAWSASWQFRIICFSARIADNDELDRAVIGRCPGELGRFDDLCNCFIGDLIRGVFSDTPAFFYDFYRHIVIPCFNLSPHQFNSS